MPSMWKVLSFEISSIIFKSAALRMGEIWFTRRFDGEISWPGRIFMLPVVRPMNWNFGQNWTKLCEISVVSHDKVLEFFNKFMLNKVQHSFEILHFGEIYHPDQNHLLVCTTAYTDSLTFSGQQFWTRFSRLIITSIKTFEVSFFVPFLVKTSETKYNFELPRHLKIIWQGCL